MLNQAPVVGGCQLALFRDLYRGYHDLDAWEDLYDDCDWQVVAAHALRATCSCCYMLSVAAGAQLLVVVPSWGHFRYNTQD